MQHARRPARLGAHGITILEFVAATAALSLALGVMGVVRVERRARAVELPGSNAPERAATPALEAPKPGTPRPFADASQR